MKTRGSSKYARALVELDVTRIVDRLIRERADIAREYREARRKSHLAAEPAELEAARGRQGQARQEAIDELVGMMEGKSQR